jgi:hypothetical protein
MDARLIIDEIRKQMQEQACTLYYSVLVPSTFHVYLPPAELDRLRPIQDRIRKEASRILEEDLAELNGSGKPKFRIPFIDQPDEALQYERNGDWQIEFHEDIDEEGDPGKPLVRAQFPESSQMEERLGDPTMRVNRGKPPSAEAAPASQTATGSAVRPKPIAVLEYQNDEGVQRYEMVRDDIKVGRGGEGRWPAWVVDGPADISREHFQIRRDAATGRFFIKDLSKFGTSVNGKRIPQGIKRENGEEVDTRAEADLPDEAVIGVADVLNIRFRATR